MNSLLIFMALSREGKTWVKCAVCGALEVVTGRPTIWLFFPVGYFIFMNLINGQPGVGLITGKFFLTDSKKGELFSTQKRDEGCYKLWVLKKGELSHFWWLKLAFLWLLVIFGYAVKHPRIELPYGDPYMRQNSFIFKQKFNTRHWWLNVFYNSSFW